MIGLRKTVGVAALAAFAIFTIDANAVVIISTRDAADVASGEGDSTALAQNRSVEVTDAAQAGNQNILIQRERFNYNIRSNIDISISTSQYRCAYMVVHFKCYRILCFDI